VHCIASCALREQGPVNLLMPLCCCSISSSSFSQKKKSRQVPCLKRKKIASSFSMCAPPRNAIRQPPAATACIAVSVCWEQNSVVESTSRPRVETLSGFTTRGHLRPSQRLACSCRLMESSCEIDGRLVSARPRGRGSARLDSRSDTTTRLGIDLCLCSISRSMIFFLRNQGA
jgi:hypothetical protein